ncbi:putative transferase, protein kinase RLK-Pelle-LRR-III family [Helianthus annuus]|nr:putative transferase, protein kinase RLK-Pelle-LRR-III family [Helianthus annuus]KAJ0552255.1 putative transferase, protein kinase RLK-Pelle-LRR-III family [Helianthus annuus]KAJ0717952.1 putative transferase, protein kinase RLK-Pelle-LRR-III family [Helianthus annuus]
MAPINLPPPILFYFCLCFCFICLQHDVVSSDIAADRAALLRLSSAVAGNTRQWNVSDPSPCNWTGVTCNNVTNRVTELRLPGDGLAGEIPVNTIGNLTALQILSLRKNRLSGSIPADIDSCSDLRQLNLQNNQFSGALPAALFRLSNINNLDISVNGFSGEISPDFSNLTSLTHLFLENNQFTGQLPELNNSFTQFNVSMNRLNGTIPESLSSFPAASFSAEVLGKGIVGTTYKAYLDHGGEVIVKRLKNVCVSKREFTKRIVSIGELDHDNLLPIKGYYYGKEEKLIVFDFIPMGSLSSILHGNMEERSQLTWEIRSKIAFEVACGLEHLHSHNLSHGNIKSNNILLSLGYQAYLSESGLIQVVSSSTPSLSGYRAPELIDTRITSKEADVYSFGILILEILTGKDPTVLLNEEGIDLPTWVQSVEESRWKNDVFDMHMVMTNDNSDKITRLLHLGIRCASQVPRRRASMAEVAKQIKKVCKF